jgi:hypothetical protein
MTIPGLTLLESYFIIGFGLGFVMAVVFVLLIKLVSSL